MKFYKKDLRSRITPSDRIYWVEDSFGSCVPPVNLDDVLAASNRLIDEYIDDNPDAEIEDVKAFSDSLWESFSDSGIIDDVTAEWED